MLLDLVARATGRSPSKGRSSTARTRCCAVTGGTGAYAGKIRRDEAPYPAMKRAPEYDFIYTLMP